MVEGSRLLSALPRDLQARIQPDLEKVSLQLRHPAGHRGETFDWVYFPTTCLISLVVDMADGSTIEAALVGNDGHTGTDLVLGSNLASNDAFAQVAGDAWRLPSSRFRSHLDDNRFRDAMASHSRREFAVISQTAACVAFHPVEQRLARWLLMVRDLLERHEFSLTHEFLAVMLGVYRPTVTIAVHVLEEAGLIDHRRGHIPILQGRRLEEAACECYHVIRGIRSVKTDS